MSGYSFINFQVILSDKWKYYNIPTENK